MNDGHIQVFVADWEIECCAPPPVVGAPTTWGLEHIDATNPWSWPELDRDRTWQVEARTETSQNQYGDGSIIEHTREAIWLVDGPVVAGPSHGDPLPEPGLRTLPGRLSGTRHGGHRRYATPAVTGIVTRIRLASAHYMPEGPRPSASAPPVPSGPRTRASMTLGTQVQEFVVAAVTLTDVTASPKRFTRGPVTEAGYTDDLGVLLDLAV